jgi:hypothetical protein
MRTINKIYLHWTATPRDWEENPDSGTGYHEVIREVDGKVIVQIVHPDDAIVGSTYHRNSDSWAISIACMYPPEDVWATPPSPAQIELMCERVAKKIKELGWAHDPDTIQSRVLTHAEAASLRDYSKNLVEDYGNLSETEAEDAGLPHNNYGPASWPDNWPGGTVERWDLYQLAQSDEPGSGGHKLRLRINELLKKG